MKTIVKITMTLVLVWLATGCSEKNATPQTQDNALALKGKTVYIKTDKADYSSNSSITQNIKDECHLDTRLISYIKEYAEDYDITIISASTIPSDALELKVEITDAMSRGNAFIGHRKFTSIAGVLSKNGTTVGSFEAARRSGGGVFGEFRGSCSVLGMTIKTLGSDVMKWVADPSMNAELGDTGYIR
jgi:hypothetical protein